MTALGRWLAHPATRGLADDDPETTRIRKNIVRSKPFLRRIYLEWYAKLVSALPLGEGEVLEVGSGAGFFAEVCPEVITSEVFLCPEVKAIMDARCLPFKDGSLRAIVMTDVLHHIPEPEAFLREAQRTLRAGGRIVMIEPWVSAWSRLVYTHFHSEPFRPDASRWTFPSTGPLSGANGALPWIIFIRDKERFRALFPALRVTRLEPFMPLRYLLSGGVSMRSLMPSWSFGPWKAFERLLSPWMSDLAMFAFIQVDRQ
jgi:SAM-dependent methyltransferase